MAFRRRLVRDALLQDTPEVYPVATWIEVGCNRMLKKSRDDVEGDCHVSRSGRWDKVHLEPPLASLACRKVCRTLHHSSAGGPDHYNLIYDATTPWRGLAEPTRPAQVSRACL